MAEAINVLTQMISLYTTQLDAYDQLSSNICMSTIAFCGVLFGIIITLYQLLQKSSTTISGSDGSKQDETIKPALNKNIKRALAIALFSIPLIITLFLYIFSMQCRKVAIYRGYLWYIEEKLNELLIAATADAATPITSNLLLFDNELVDVFINGNGGYKFLTNQWGPLFLGLFLFLIMCLSCVLIYTYADLKSERKAKSSFYKYFSAVFCVLIGLCVIESIICFSDLTANGKVMEDVYRYCLEHGLSLMP